MVIAHAMASNVAAGSLLKARRQRQDLFLSQRDWDADQISDDKGIYRQESPAAATLGLLAFHSCQKEFVTAWADQFYVYSACRPSFRWSVRLLFPEEDLSSTSTKPTSQSEQRIKPGRYSARHSGQYMIRRVSPGRIRQWNLMSGKAVLSYRSLARSLSCCTSSGQTPRARIRCVLKRDAKKT
jgi:hypothetical protein